MAEEGGKEDEEAPDGRKCGAVPAHGDPRETMQAFSVPAIQTEEMSPLVLRVVARGMHHVLAVGSGASRNFWIDEPLKQSVDRGLVFYLLSSGCNVESCVRDRRRLHT